MRNASHSRAPFSFRARSEPATQARTSLPNIAFADLHPGSKIDQAQANLQ